MNAQIAAAANRHRFVLVSPVHGERLETPGGGVRTGEGFRGRRLPWGVSRGLLNRVTILRLCRLLLPRGGADWYGIRLPFPTMYLVT